MTQAVSAHKEQACICRDLGTPRGLSLKQANDLFWLQNNFLSVTDLLLHPRLLLGSVIRVLEKDWRRKNSSAPLLLCFSILSNCFSSDPSPCSVTQSCPTLCNPMDCSTPGFPVHHQLPELAQTHVHRVSDAIQPSHPLLFPSPPCLQSFPAAGSFPLSQFFTFDAEGLELQHQSLQWILEVLHLVRDC